jgi:hypothetical protein
VTAFLIRQLPIVKSSPSQLAVALLNSTASLHLDTSKITAIMKSSLLFSLCAAAAVTALSAPREPQVILQEPTLVEPDEYLIELSPGKTRWIKEVEKWELRKVSVTELEV